MFILSTTKRTTINRIVHRKYFMTQNNIEAVGVTIKKVPSFILEVELNYYILIV